MSKVTRPRWLSVGVKVYVTVRSRTTLTLPWPTTLPLRIQRYVTTVGRPTLIRPFAVRPRDGGHSPA